MKTKNLYVLGIGIVSLLFLIFLVIVPFLIFFHHIWTANSIVLALGIIGLILYLMHQPGSKMSKFHEFGKEIKVHPSKRHNFKYRKAKYSFSCAQAASQMLLEKLEIYMKQDEILALSGDKTLGTTAQELRDTLNTIFHDRNTQLVAKIRNFTDQKTLNESMEKGYGIIVMYINEFYEEGYPEGSNYPHFALVNCINIYENWIQLTKPSFSPEKDPTFQKGMPMGEIRMSLFPEFQERFYMGSEYFRRIKYKPTKGIHSWYTLWWNHFLNFIFIFAMYVGYCTTILKPGSAIFVEPIDKKE